MRAASRAGVLDVGQQAGARAAAARPRPRASSRAVCFRPKRRICSGVGPMKRDARPRRRRSAKSAFSRQEAVAGVDRLGAGAARGLEDALAAQVALGRPAPGRCSTASSARRDVQGVGVGLGVDRDASAMPRRRSVRMMRQAISPRLAIRTLLNIDGHGRAASQTRTRIGVGL